MTTFDGRKVGRRVGRQVGRLVGRQVDRHARIYIAASSITKNKLLQKKRCNILTIDLIKGPVQTYTKITIQ